MTEAMIAGATMPRTPDVMSLFLMSRRNPTRGLGGEGKKSGASAHDMRIAILAVVHGALSQRRPLPAAWALAWVLAWAVLTWAALGLCWADVSFRRARGPRGRNSRARTPARS